MTLEQDWLEQELRRDDLIAQVPKLLEEIERLRDEVRCLKRDFGAEQGIS